MAGLARTTALSLLALFALGLWLTHRSLRAATGRPSPGARLAAIEGDVLARLEAQSKRADEAEKLAEEAIEFSKTLRLERDEALQSLAALDAAPPARAVSRDVEDWLGGKPPPAAPAPPPKVVQLPKPAALAATPYMPAKDASPLRVCYEHEGEPQGSKRVIQLRFNMSVPRARVPKKASTLRDRSER